MKPIVLCLSLLLPLSASAQIKCTMPGGVVSVFKLADHCPDGAIKSEKNGVTETLWPKPAEPYRVPTLRPVSVPQPPARIEPPKGRPDGLRIGMTADEARQHLGHPAQRQPHDQRLRRQGTVGLRGSPLPVLPQRGA